MATAPRTQTRAVIAELVQSPTLPVLLILAAMVIGIAALLPLVQSSGATTTAGNIQALEQEKTSWQAQLRELETQVATLGSLNRIEAEARDRLGMEPPQVTHYITVDVPPPQPLLAERAPEAAKRVLALEGPVRMDAALVGTESG